MIYLIYSFIFIKLGTGQIRIENHIFPVTVSSSETKYETPERTDTVYDEPIGIVAEPQNNLTTAQITEYYEKDKLDKWNKNHLLPIYSMWRMTKENAPYKTNMEIITNNQPETDDNFFGNIVKAEKFFQGSGIPFSTSRPIIRSISSEPEITMSMHSISNNVPEVASENIDESITLLPLPLISSINVTTEAPLITLQPLATKAFEDISHSSPKSTSFEGSWEEEPSNGAAVTIDKLPETTEKLLLLPLEITGPTDVAVLPRMHNDVQRLIQEVNVIKVLINKLLLKSYNDGRKNRKRHTKMNGSSAATSGALRLIAHQKIEDSREGNYIHMWPEVTTQKFTREISIDDFKI